LDFQPCYTWPNNAFPFRLYLDAPQARIFIIENIFHNFNWLNEYSSRIKNTDIFFVILGWHHGDWHAKHSKDCIEACGLDIANFIILCNDYGDYGIFRDHGFTCSLVNQNCFLDYNLFAPEASCSKLYDAVYVARLTPFKRHHLAANATNLAIVSGDLHGGSLSDYIPNVAYRNDRQLAPHEVKEIICSSRVGLILSALEGACFASSEYLLCGVPVVSTTSLGGRSIWYNEYNSIVCDADPSAIANAVSDLIKKSPSALKIRRQHIELSNRFRSEFVKLLDNVFSSYYIDLNPIAFFNENYFHKMRHSIKPDFSTIFSD
jgi:glycosyltransferase involved in cell wall biosynthesis